MARGWVGVGVGIRTKRGTVHNNTRPLLLRERTQPGPLFSRNRHNTTVVGSGLPAVVGKKRACLPAVVGSGLVYYFIKSNDACMSLIELSRDALKGDK